MKAILINNGQAVIRACYTEDKNFCIAVGGTLIIWGAIDNCVTLEMMKAKNNSIFRVEDENGDIAGFAIVQFLPVRKVVDYFIRPLKRYLEDEFIIELNNVLNNMLVPLPDAKNFVF